MGADDERYQEKVNEILTQFFLIHVSFERAISKLAKYEVLGEAQENLDKARFHLGELGRHIEQILTTDERSEVANV